MPSKDKLKKLIDKIKTKQFRDGEAKGLISRIQEEQTNALKPVLENISKSQSESLTKTLADSFKGIKVDVPQVEIPPVEIPPMDVGPLVEAIQAAFGGVRIPTPRVDFDASRIKIPDIKMPEKMSIDGWIGMMGYDASFLKNPLPVQLRDKDGKPVDISKLGQQAVVGGGGGKADHFTVKEITKSIAAVLLNPDGGPLAISASISGGGSQVSLVNADGDYYNSDNPLPVSFASSVQPVSQVSGQSWSVFASLETTAALFNADNRLRVSVETGGSGLTDSELRASAVPVTQVSGAAYSVVLLASDNTPFNHSGGNLLVNVQNFAVGQFGNSDDNAANLTSALSFAEMFAYDSASDNWDRVRKNEGDAAGALRVVHASDVGASVRVTDIFGSTAANVVNPDGRLKVELPTGSSGLTDSELRASSVPVSQASDSLFSVRVTDVFSTTQASTVVNADNRVKVELPTNSTLTIGNVNVNGTTNSVVVVGDLASDAADTGSSPIKIGGIARQANPTAVAAGDRIAFSSDDLGRQVMRPIQVRDLIRTAYVSVTNGTETTLLAGVAGAYLDCIMIVGSNNSDAAVSVDIRAVTAGNIIHTLRIPANGTAGWTPQVPWPQDETGNNWTIDGPDETGRTLTFSALFSREV